jgi:transcriptional regulator with XRE-family HTH domain
MAGRGRDARSYFAWQLKREREAAGWTLTELGRRAGIHPAHLGRIESGDRPPTAKVADGLDRAWPHRHHFWRSLYDDSQGWREIPTGFRNWAEHEAETSALRIWQSGLVDGTVQTPDYAAAVLATETALDDATRSERLMIRMQRSQRLIDRLRGVNGGKPLLATILVDEVALIRDVGGPKTMAGQMRYLAEIAALPAVTLMVVPVRAHQAMASGCIITDSAVWSENLVTGGVYTDEQVIRDISMRHSNLAAEAYRASESLEKIEEAAKSWQSGRPPQTGGKAHGQPGREASAWK